MAPTGESPLWDPVRNTLWWIDIQGQRLLGHGETGDICIPLPQMPGLVALAADGDLVVGLEDGLWLLSPERCLATVVAGKASGDSSQSPSSRPTTRSSLAAQCDETGNRVLGCEISRSRRGREALSLNVDPPERVADRIRETGSSRAMASCDDFEDRIDLSAPFRDGSRTAASACRAPWPESLSAGPTAAQGSRTPAAGGGRCW